MPGEPLSLREPEAGEETSPGRSILGLARIEPAPFRIPASRNGAAPPHATILGLSELERAPIRLPVSPAARNGEPPNASLLGLGGLDAAPLRARTPRREGDEFPGTTLLGLADVAPRPLPGIFRPAPRRPVAGRASASFFGLAAPAPAVEEHSRSFFGLTVPAAGLPRVEPVEVPEFERDVTHRPERGFPIERAMLASILAHAVLLLLLVVTPKGGAHDPRKGLLAALVPPEKVDDKIPLVFHEAPGPKRENPKKSELSDADRRAGGGDRSKPKAASPYVPELPGMRGVAPGRPAIAKPFERPRVAQARPAAPPGGSKAAPEPQPETKTAQNELEGLRVPPAGKREGPEGSKPLADLNSVARQAAREVAGQGAISGQGGAGFPNPDGGFVDAGPISFETSWYDWGEYLQAMLAKIKAHWKPAMEPFRWKTTVQFAIHPDGTITDLLVVRPSANPAFTFGAQKAISGSNPLPPLPKDLLASVGSDHIEHVRIMFLFNYRTGDWEAPESAK